MTQSAPKLPVLIVDDSAIYRKLVEQTLEKEPYAPLFAKNGREALDLYAEHAPALVITDWMMPDYSGLQLCQHIRMNAKGPYTYILVLTSNSEKKNVVRGLAAGADDYLTKPFHPGELLARLGVGRRTVELHREIATKNKLLEEMAHTDPLTGLPNRRAIEEWSKRQLHSAARHGFSMWVVHADLDGFKGVNDKYGHEAGDEVLKRFGEVLRANTRASDICGRMGGDEFMLVVTHVAEQNIGIVAERMRAQLSSQKFSFGGEPFSLTVSIGVCGFKGKEPPELAKLVRQADQAMYVAKRAGRNQTKIEYESA